MKVSTLIALMVGAGLGGIIYWLNMQWHNQGRLTWVDWTAAALSLVISTGIFTVIGRYAWMKYPAKPN